METEAQQQQTTSTDTDKELQLDVVEQHAEQLLVQVADLQSSAEKTQLSLQSEQQSSSAAAHRSSQLEQQLLTSQASLKQLQEQLDASTQSAASAMLSLQGKLSCNKFHLTSSCLLLLLLSKSIACAGELAAKVTEAQAAAVTATRLELSYRSSKSTPRACSPNLAKHSRPSKTSKITRLLRRRRVCQSKPA